MMERKEYVEYWNQWMKKWNDFVNRDEKDRTTLFEEWPLLNHFGSKKEGLTKEEAWKFFPEPYWGNPLSNNLKGVFINFNPGEGDFFQHWNKHKDHKLGNKIWQYFPSSNYYKTISKLYLDAVYPTTKWMKNKRERFIKGVYTHLGKSSDGEYVMLELCPWHTKSVTKEVYQYIEDNIEQIDNYIIKFAEACSMETNGYFKNIVITKGLDKDRVERYLKRFNFVNQEFITKGSNGELLKREWAIDIFKLKNSDVYFFNFKNSSNGFPANINDLVSIFRNYTKF